MSTTDRYVAYFTDSTWHFWIIAPFFLIVWLSCLFYGIIQYQRESKLGEGEIGREQCIGEVLKTDNGSVTYVFKSKGVLDGRTRILMDAFMKREARIFVPDDIVQQICKFHGSLQMKQITVIRVVFDSGIKWSTLYQVGDDIEIVYDPVNPKRYNLPIDSVRKDTAGNPSFMACCFCMIICTFITFGIVCGNIFEPESSFVVEVFCSISFMLTLCVPMSALIGMCCYLCAANEEPSDKHKYRSRYVSFEDRV